MLPPHRRRQQSRQSEKHDRRASQPRRQQQPRAFVGQPSARALAPAFARQNQADDRREDPVGKIGVVRPLRPEMPGQSRYHQKQKPGHERRRRTEPEISGIVGRKGSLAHGMKGADSAGPEQGANCPRSSHQTLRSTSRRPSWLPAWLGRSRFAQKYQSSISGDIAIRGRRNEVTLWIFSAFARPARLVGAVALNGLRAIEGAWGQAPLPDGPYRIAFTGLFLSGFWWRRVLAGPLPPMTRDAVRPA